MRISQKISILALFFLYPQVTQAADATLFLSSGSGVWQTNKAITTRLIVNSGGTDINAASGIIKYDPKMIRVEKIDRNKSIFELWTKQPLFDNKAGTITFSGGAPKKIRSNVGFIMNITFTPLRSGKTDISFASGSSMILAANGSGSNIIKEAWTANYNFGTLAAVNDGRRLAKRVSGNILLQVEKKGEAWYVFPNDNRRYFLGRPEDAFNLMRKLGLGVTHDYMKQKIFPTAVTGKILIDVGDKGKAYYIHPKTRVAIYLGRPDDAFQVMRKNGIGISNDMISKIDDWAI